MGRLNKGLKTAKARKARKSRKVTNRSGSRRKKKRRG